MASPSHFRRFLALAAATLVPGSKVHAFDYYWNTTTTGSWGTGANWSDNSTSGGTTGVVPGASDSVFFNQSSVSGAEIVTLDADRSITGITFNNTGTTAIAGGKLGILALEAGGTATESGAGAIIFNAATKPDGNQTWTNNCTAGPSTVSSSVTNIADLAACALAIGFAGTTRFNGIISVGGVIDTMAGVAYAFSGGTKNQNRIA